jgi:hypothetical protein
MATKCLSLVKGRRIRLTKLDACGRPVYGDGSSAVSSGFISVALTANTSDSDEINVTNANGDVCIFEPAVTSLTGYGVEITFCEVDPELFALATSQDPYIYNGDAIGFTVNINQDEKNAFALELWAGASGGDACADPNAAGNFGYLLLPFLYGGIIGDFTVENDAVTFTITGANTRTGNGWGAGPYADVFNGTSGLGALPVPLDPDDALLTILTTAAPPAAACGTRPLLDPAAEELTGLTVVVAGLVGTFTFVPDDITTGVQIDFGDGTWDYIEAGTLDPVLHTYVSGNYTAKASTNGIWVSTPVVVV